MANITTRATAGANATVKGTPLTNAELDGNFIALNNDIATREVVDADGGLSATEFRLTQANVAALHRSPNATTAMFVYDTSKDSDGGAWTEKCQHTSWYNEALNGKWLGAWLNETEARNAGATVGEERITAADPGFGSSTGWTLGTNISIADGKLVFAAVPNAQSASVTVAAAVVGVTYQVQIKIDTLTAGTIRIAHGGVTRDFGAASGGTQTIYLVASNASTSFTLQAIGTTTATIDLVSAKHVTATTTATGDYYQLATDGKFYRLWKNLNTNSTVVPTSSSSIVYSGNSGVGPDGLNNATSAETIAAVGNSSSGWHSSFATIPIGGTISFYVKSLTGDGRVIGQLGNGDGYEFDAINGVMITSDARHGYTIASAPNGYWRLAIQRISPTSGSGLFIVPKTIGNKILVSNIQIEYGPVSSFESKTGLGSQTETFRGNKAKFPKLAAFVGETYTITVYDLTEPGRPMWMRFQPASSNSTHNGAILSRLATTGIYVLNGRMGVSGNGDQGPYNEVNFPADSGYTISNYQEWSGRFKGKISARNESLGRFPNTFSPLINSAFGYAVAMTVLPDAPIDAATGLRVPTVAVAGGPITLIKHNGTIVNGGQNLTFTGVAIDEKNIFATRTGAPQVFYAQKPGELANGFTLLSGAASAAPPDLFRQSGAKLARTALRRYAVGAGSAYAGLLAHNETTFAASLSAAITDTYNTGWQVGDIRRTYAADVAAGTVTGTELVTNGTFNTDTTGWNAISGGVLSVDTNRLLITNGNFGAAGQYITVVPGRTYILRGTYTAGTAATGRVIAYYGNENGISVQKDVVTGPFFMVFVGQGSSCPLAFALLSGTSGQTGFYDNISVTEAVVDRSYKAQGATVNGTLTKSAVDTGSQLVGYSGFSAANYLQEPYSADLDFGTGEWSASAWMKVGTNPVMKGNSVTGSSLASTWGFSLYGMILQDANQTLPGIGAVSKVVHFNAASGNDSPMSRVLASGQVFSFYAKAGELKYMHLRADGGTSAYPVGFWFDMETGTELSNTYGAANINWSAAPEVGTGWYRFWVTGANGQMIKVFAPNNSQNVFAGDGVSGYFVAGAQLEFGSTPTAFIPTSGSPVNYTYPVVSRAGATGPAVTFGMNTAGFLSVTMFDGTTTRTAVTTSLYNQNAWLKAEAYYRTGRLAIAVNGVEVASTNGAPLLSLNGKYNLVNWSEQIDNAAWTKNGCTVTVNTTATTDPIGGNTADVLVESAATELHRISQNIVYTGGATTASVYLKAGTHRYAYLELYGSPELNRGIGVDLQTGTAISLTDIPAPTSSSVVAVGTDGWYRVSVTYTMAAGTIGVYVGTASGPGGTRINPGSTSNTIYVWGVDVRSAAFAAAPYQRTTTVAETNVPPLTIGNSFALDAPFPGSLALVKASATVPSAEQMAFAYGQEAQMFRAGAQVTLPSSGSVVDLSYDDATDRWVTVQPTHESLFTGLVRVATKTPSAGSFTKVATGSGIELLARSTTVPGVDISIPAYNLREELVKDGEAAGRLNASIAAIDYDTISFTAAMTSGSATVTASSVVGTPYVGMGISGTGVAAGTTILGINGTTYYLSANCTATASNAVAQTDFTLPAGMTAVEVMSAGVIKREGSTKDFVRRHDGFRETIRFATSPGAASWVQIQAQREVQQ